MSLEKKINIKNLIDWKHHRFGWNYVVEKINQLQNDFGTLCYTNGTFAKFICNYEQIHIQNWIGFFHVTESDPHIIDHLSTNKILQKNLKSCRGIYVFSNKTKDFLKQYIDANIESIKHPLPPKFSDFNIDQFLSNKKKKVFFVGHWLRNYKDFIDLSSPYEKVLLKCEHTPKSLQGSYLKNEEYDGIFQKNIFFLSLYDSSANNTVLECMSNNTPIIINRLPALEEYLGKSYPLFYTEIKEAVSILENENTIIEGYEYLKKMDKSGLNLETFIQNFSNTSIYKNLPNRKFML